MTARTKIIRKGNTTGPRSGKQPPPNGQSPIIIRGARVNNLKNISLELPRNKLTVFTGVSGSGKSSLVFDTIYAEGQRRFVESLSAYARQFLERMDKPDVDFIQGISPAIAIEQKTPPRNPRSTVGTSTEIYDYLRLLYGRVGKTFCRQCGKIVQRDSVQTVLEKLRRESPERKSPAGEREDVKLYVLSPMHEHRDSTFQQELDNLKKQGFFRVLYRNELVDLNESTLPAKTRKKDVLILVDRLVYRRESDVQRLADSIETAFKAGDGYAIIKLLDHGKELRFNQHYECAECGIRYEEPDPRLFSFNNPFGACPKCQGFGRSVGIDMDLVVPDKGKTIREGAILPWTFPRWRGYLRDLLDNASAADVRIDVPFNKLSAKELATLWSGNKSFDGIEKFFKYIERKSYKVHYRVFLSRFRSYTTCDVCNGARLRPEALNIKVGGKTISDVVQATIDEDYQFFQTLELSAFERGIARRILEELLKRLKYLVGVGIGYLTLDRLSNSLSGGESQRINLSTALGSSLVGSLYVLDEPSIGMHPRDIQKLIALMKSLRDVGNSVLVVEHDAEIIAEADVIVDMGPRAGEFGGEIIFQGTIDQLRANQDSITGRYLNGTLAIPVPEERRKGSGRKITIMGAAEHNLKNINVEIPLNTFVCVTGVSGSGKSTLIHDILYPGIRMQKPQEDAPSRREFDHIGAHRAIKGAEFIDEVELVDQSPIGKTPRSNPSTYIKAFDAIRELFADTQAAKIRGFKPGYFSFNVPGGRCDACEGSGVQTVEMQFLADIELRCEVCQGKRFKKEVLAIQYHGKNVDDVLRMTVTGAIEFFGREAAGRNIVRRLQVLEQVGMGYIRLGQSSTTLSGGEAQRVKLASHLVNQDRRKHTLFIFDEPTTGLHFDDIAKLLRCFDALIESGNSILTIEHNMEVIKCADWVIDLGPEAGNRGGEVVAVGTPERLAECENSYTGQFLRKYLK
jgi:excinuclease ABC subunit A